jgi:Clp amino terminal domain, pathogenicity island component
MFERYTEKARRSIFFARWEASRFGSAYIEPEHMLLGLARCTNIVDQTLRAEIQQIAVHNAPTSTSVDLPVSQALKRAMHFAAEESEKLGHQHIGVEHLLLGLMVDDPDSPVPDLLRKHGINRELVLSQVPVEEPVDRESLRALVDSLPQESLRPAKRMLEHMQTPLPLLPPPPFGAVGGWGGGGRGGGGGGWNFARPGTWGTPPRQMRQGRRSFSRREDGVEVVETHHLRDGCEITLIERFRLSEDGKTLSYTQEVTGPGKSEQHTIDFNVG